MKHTPIVIGRAEAVDFPGQGLTRVPARVDTGARTSSIWASHIAEKDGVVEVVFFGKTSPFYTGETHHFEGFGRAIVASSNGQYEERFKVRLTVSLAGKKIRARFTLADRSTQVYPVLIGRNVLRGKFIVDVKRGTILRDEEKNRSQELQSELNGKA